jgi:hypothetical protein
VTTLWLSPGWKVAESPDHSEMPMLRAATLALCMVAAASAAFGADLPPYAGRHAPPPAHVERDPDLLITPAYGPGGYLGNLPGTPILPGSSTIPGYYGRAFSYNYQGPYYGGPYEGYFFRLPYACGVHGYC